MDVNRIFEASLNNLEDEDIKKKIDTSEELSTVLSTLPSKEVGLATSAYELAASGEPNVLGTYDDLRKYLKNGITPNNWANLDKQLADSQSNWTKLGNGLAQAVVSEVGLGSIGAVADIFNYVAKSILHLTDEDYQNPVSETIKEWQDEFNNNIAPVFTDPDVNIQNGGLSDFGWYCKNIPNIASTLMLLLPAKGFTLAATKLIKGSKFATNIGNARRWATGVNKIEDASQLSKFQAAVNSEIGVARANKFFEIGGEALIMRTAENYQEARETYTGVYKEALDTFNQMDDASFKEWANQNKQIFGNENIDINDKNEVAKYIARKSADRTFAMDFSNIVFDIVQLYGLRNFGKGVKQIGQSRKIRAMQKNSISDAVNITPATAATESVAAGAAEGATGAAGVAGGSAAEESLSLFSKLKGWGKSASNGIYDFGKYQSKTILEESTEGIEEAVNYIAQQEGITYGKMLLKGLTDGYEDTWWTAIPSTWTKMNGSLNDYMNSPELQESAFWGVVGGWAFGNVGNVANRAQLAFNRYQENKEDRENPITGEKVERSSISELFEASDTKAARLAIDKRKFAWANLSDKLKAIQNKKDPYSNPQNGEYADFTGDIPLKQSIARARAISEFRSELAVTAINSGTYDMLVEYLTSNEVKDAMVRLGLTTKEEANSFVQETLSDLEDAKTEYAKQSAHVMNQISLMNGRRGKYAGVDENIEEGDKISMEYARIIANENYQRVRAIRAIEREIQNLGVLEAEQINILDTFNKNVNVAQAKSAVAIAGLLTAYQRISADEKRLQQAQPTNALQRLDKFNKLEQIKSQKEALLRQLKNTTFAGTNSSLSNVYNAISLGLRSKYNTTTREVEESIAVTDAEILKNVREFFGDEIKDKSDEDIVKEATKLNKQLNTLLNENNENSIVNANKQLFRIFDHTTQLELQKAMQQSLINSSVSQIRERVNYYHNNLNEVRKQKLTFAEEIIRKAIEQYDGVKTDDGTDLIQTIAEAYLGNIEEARKIAESVMATPGEGAVTASEFIDALNILALQRKSNKLLFNWIMGVINQDRLNRRQLELENSTSQNGNSAQNNPEVNNPSPQPQNPNRGQQNGQIEPQNGQTEPINQQNNQPKKGKIKVVINNRGNIVSVKKDNGTGNGKNVFPVIEHPDGNIELDTESMTISQQLDLIASGLFDVDDDVDFVASDSNFVIESNPIIKLNKNNPPSIVKKGHIIKENTEAPASETTPPVEGNNNQGQAPGASSNEEEGGNEAETEEDSEEEDSEEEIPDSENPFEGSPLPPLPPYGGAIPSGTQSSNPSTGEGVGLDEQITLAISSNITDLTKPGIKFDEIETKVIEEITAANPNTDKATIEREVKEAIARTKAANDYILGLNNPVLQTGAAAVYSSKIEDVDSTDFTSLFDSSAKAFMDEYSKLLIVDKVDGKQIIRLEDIMRLCKAAYPSSNTNELSSFFNVIKNYLIKNSDKYEVVDLNQSDNVINDINKDREQRINEEYPEGEFRVNIRAFIDSANAASQQAKDDYFNALDSLKEGDKVQLVVEEDALLIKVNGVTIGNMPKPSVVGNRYRQINLGWITDITLDANGEPVSRSMDIIHRLFLGNTVANDELRKLLTRLSVLGENITEEDVKEFELNPAIASLIAQAKQLKEAGEENTIFKFDENDELPTKEMLLYLTRLWKFTNTATIETSKERVLNNVAINIDRWFRKLYRTYNAVSNITKDQDITVTKMKGGSIVKAFNDNVGSHYEELPLATDVISDLDNARLTAINFESSNNVLISGRPSITLNAMRPASTFVSLFNGSDTTPYFAEAYGIKLSDSQNVRTNPELSAIGNYCIKYLTDVISDVINSNSDVASLNALSEALNAIIATNRPNGSIPIFRPDAAAGTFTIEPISIRNSIASGFNISIRMPNGSVSRFKFYTKTDHGAKFAYTTRNGSTLSISERNKAVIAQDAANSFFFWLKDKARINIDFQGIKDDSIDTTNHKGFINKKNGKLVISIPTKTAAPYNKEFDSYSDFIVRNNLVKVNTKKSKNGKNFERFGENQKFNSILCVSLPIVNPNTPVNNTTQTRQLPSNVKLEENTTEENYNKLVDSFEGGSISGEKLLTTILPANYRIRLEEVVAEEQLEIADLFPSSIEYNGQLNDYGYDNVNEQDIAVTTGGNGSAVYHIYENGIRKPQPGNKINRTIVGPRFVNMAASNLKSARYNAIKILMHERIHNILQSRNNKSKDLLKELSIVFEEFKRLALIDIANYKSNKENSNLTKDDFEHLERLIKVYNNAERSHKALITQGKDPSYRHIEELLVDSLTNGFLYNYLNSKTVDNAENNNKPENLLTKILKAIAKFFGWKDVNNNSLLMKELNILREGFDNNSKSEKNINESENNISQNEEESQENQDETEDEEIKDEEEAEDEESETFLNDDDISFLNYDETIIDDDTYSSIIEDKVNVEDGYIQVDNVDSFKNRLPVELQSQFASLVNDGLIETKCYM